MTTVGLCMIVKNEEHVIERCLDSCRPIVDYVLVCDTGSTDDTHRKVMDWAGRTGVVSHVCYHDWIDFGTNRSMALAKLRSTTMLDYALMMDADDRLIVDPGLDVAAWKAALTADMYDVLIEHGPIRHWRPQIFRSATEFRYRGVLHEFVEGPAGHSRGRVDGVRIMAGVEGHRSSDPQKYLKDAELLSRALRTETDEHMRRRYAFYLAQSYKDAGGREELASEFYQWRANMGGWEGEVYISLLRTGQLMEGTETPGEEIIATYMRAFEADPRRAETLQAATRYCHRTGRHHQGYMIGKHGITVPRPTDAKLFEEPWVYEWGMADDFAVAAYWSGHYAESLESAQTALVHAPPEHRQRIEDNIRFAREKLSGRIAAAECHDNPATDSETVDFTVVAVEPPGYTHSGAYAELAETVLYGLRALGYTAELRHDRDWSSMGGKIIVIGAHLIVLDIYQNRNDLIIYNTEHHTNLNWGVYRSFLKKHPGPIWDYSSENAARLTEMLGRPVTHVPVGYVSEMTRVTPAAAQDIDVLFYGSLNDRRAKVLDDLRAAGLSVKHLFGVYGAERDAYIARAKVVLNMHYYEPGVFEAVRVGYLLANKKAVVCEDDDAGEAYRSGAIVCESDEELVDTCRVLVTGDNFEREDAAREGFEIFSAMGEPEILRTALRRKVWDCFLYNGEADVLEIRLHELKAVVDRFVIVEADTTFSGQPKEQMGDGRKSTSWYYNQHKISYVFVTDMPETDDPWERERHQRNAISRGLGEAAADDLIMISDVDEIPRAAVVREMAEDRRNQAFGLRLAFGYFLLNYRCTSGSEANKVWNGAITKKWLDESTPDTVRYAIKNADRDDLGPQGTRVIDDAGWHFSYLGDDNAVRAKIRAFSHQEYNTSTVLDTVDVERMVREGEDLFGRPGYGWRLVGMDDLPEWVKSQPEMVKKWTRRLGQREEDV